ncbi:MAG: CpsD/CapB family tyrosine-protein kinase [Firmicutes bacterium]|nr:CpsD/CapB family tyrosine-protein kinase [Bacillota bacterium]
MGRVLEAYVGEYASGKSENAINRGVQLARSGRRVRLVDLDLVEPFYTLRPLKRRLEQEGLEVLAWETSELVGLGEAAIPLKKEIKTALDFTGDVIIDVGYGVDGRKQLNLITDGFTPAADGSRLRLLMVVNMTRPLTSSVSLILAYLGEFGPVDGLINNTHLGEETTVAVIQEGAVLVTEAARRLGLPVVATAALRPYARRIGAYDRMGNPVRPLDRYMADAFW